MVQYKSPHLTGGKSAFPSMKLSGTIFYLPVYIAWELNLVFIYSEGQTKRVVGEGMPLVNSPEKRGDLVIKFHVLFPRSLKPEQKTLIRQALH